VSERVNENWATATCSFYILKNKEKKWENNEWFIIVYSMHHPVRGGRGGGAAAAGAELADILHPAALFVSAR
jgi:hypothetical protein